MSTLTYYYLYFFFLYFIFSSSIHTGGGGGGVHAQSEDGFTNPIDTNEPPARLVALIGCAALVIYDNNAYHRLCWDAPVTIYPHSDGIYRITIYTGFPYTTSSSPSSPSISDAAPAKTRPKHAQYYEWWGYRNLFVGLDGCLRVAGWDGFWAGFQSLGECPLSDSYPLTEPDLINPYII